MTKMYDGTKQSTKKLRFTLLAAFFNYIKNSVDPEFQNPCDNPALKKLFRAGKLTQFKILEKDVVDEIIFRTPNPRNRLMLELMARACMRVGEVLKLRAKDIEDRKATIRDPKSGKETEIAFLPQKVADRLKRYIRENKIKSDLRIFPITYAAARIVVKKAGNLVGIHLKPHDLRRHASTYVSRSGTPIEIVSSAATSFEPVDHPKVFGKNKRCRGNAVDRQSPWIMQAMAGLATLVFVRLFYKSCLCINYELYMYPQENRPVNT